MPRKTDLELPRRTPDMRGPDGRVPAQALAHWERNERRFRRGVWLTCSTPECPNSQRSWYDECDDNADGIWRVMCGLCEEWIEVITEAPGKSGFTRAEREAQGKPFE